MESRQGWRPSSSETDDVEGAVRTRRIPEEEEKRENREKSRDDKLLRKNFFLGDRTMNVIIVETNG